MASSGVNLLLCATTHGDGGGVAFIADGEASAQTAPGSAGTGYLIRPALTIRMQNQPGIGAATCTVPKLAYQALTWCFA